MIIDDDYSVGCSLAEKFIEVRIMQRVKIKEGLQLERALWIDTRTPNEYREGTIPGAINLPIFTNQERHRVGKLYSQDPEEAKFLALSYAAPSLPGLVDRIGELDDDRELIVFCWRGGMRSRGLVTVLQLLGFDAYQLEGGYRAFRQYVLDGLESILNQLPPMVLVYGLTGAGKTELIRVLKSTGYSALDLEDLACHRGSAFGHLGMEEEQNQKNFEARLLFQLKEELHSPYILLEAESRCIGKIVLPDLLVKRMQEGERVLLQSSLERRVERIVTEYASTGVNFSSQAASSIRRLSNKLGKKRVTLLCEELEEGAVDRVVKYLLTHYYDPLYLRSIKDKDFELVLTEDNIMTSVHKLASYLQKKTPKIEEKKKEK